MAPAMENAKPSVEVPFSQMPTAQMPITQMPVITQTAFTQMPFMAAANAPSMENAKPSMQEAPIQILTPQKPSVQIPTPQKPSTQMPMAQKPIIAQTASAHILANTPFIITIKAPSFTHLQPMASLESLEVLDHLEPLVPLVPLENLEPLETVAMASAMENAKLSVQEVSIQIPTQQKPFTQMPMAHEPSTQMPMAQKPIIAQTASAHSPANTPFIITVKASTFTHLQPMVSLEPLENLESLEILKPLVPLAHLENLENLVPLAHLKPLVPLAHLEPLVPLAHLETLETLETAAMPYAMENTKLSTPMPSAQKPFTAQTQSAHVSTNTPYITIKASHSFAQKLEAPEKFTQKSPSTPVTDTPSIHAAATAISQPTDLAMPSVTPIKASPMAMSPAQILSTTVNELTAAIMVNIDENGHLGEIRLVLKPDVLDGTTILLKCDQKQISVTFFPGAESAEQLLMANQSRIAETLAATGHLPVKISIINSEGRRQIRKIA